MPEDRAPERVNRRYVAFKMMFDPADRPGVDFSQGSEVEFSQLVENYKDVVRHSLKLTPIKFLSEEGEVVVSAQCKVLVDRSIACRRIAIAPERAAHDFDGVAEAFAMTARPVSRLPDGRDPIGMKFTKTLRFRVED